MIDEIKFKAFLVDISGFNNISNDHLRSIFNRTENHFGIGIFENILKIHQIDNTKLSELEIKIVKSITYCLYTGFFPGEENELQRPEDYFESMIWKVIQAHPPALSGGYFGYWRYPPELFYE